MSALGGIFAALKTLIAATPEVTDLLKTAPAALGGGPAIYDDGAAPQPSQAQPMSALSPWLTIGAGTGTQFSALRKRGWNCTLQLKVTAEGSEETGLAIVAELSALLMPDTGARYLTVAGFGSCWVADFAPQPTLVSTIGGKVTREFPILLRVFAQ